MTDAKADRIIALLERLCTMQALTDARIAQLVRVVSGERGVSIPRADDKIVTLPWRGKVGDGDGKPAA